MNKLLVKIYGVIPNGLKLKLGQSQLLKGFKQFLLYNSKGFKTAQIMVKRTYSTFNLNFQFVASIKMAAKAKNVGIENTVLNNSFRLIESYKPNRTDLVVLDVGANFGYLASVWANSIAAKGKTFAFEPNKNLYSCIEKTIEVNIASTNFEAYNLAVGSKNGSISLNASNFSSNTEAMSAAIETYNVEMVRLDDFVKDNRLNVIDLIKIDVDGIELDILRGAEHILKQNKTIVIVETNNDIQIIEFFEKLNYSIFNMQLEKFKDGDVLPLNIFCIPKSLEEI